MVGLFFTAFERNGGPCPQLNTRAVTVQAALAKKQSVDVVLIGGTTDEWPSLTVDERVEIATKWRKEVPFGT